MTDDLAPAEILKVSRELTVSVAEMTEELRKVNERQDAAGRFGRRNRLLIQVALGAIVVIVVTLLAVFGYERIGSTAGQLRDQRATLLSSCRSGNLMRTQEIALFYRLLAPSNSSARTPAQRASAEAYVRQTFVLRDCARLFGKS